MTAGSSGTQLDDADGPDPEKLLALAKAGFDQVLDATKHQDDKIGRFLTALAFLTTGALALLARQQTPYRIGSHSVPLGTYALAAYLMLALTAAALWLFCLGSRLRVPYGGASAEEVDDASGPKVESLLYFGPIAKVRARAWKDEWAQDVSSLTKKLARNYWLEIRNIATRVEMKYERSGEAAATFILALLFLALALVFTFDRLLEPSGVHFTFGLRLSVAVILSGHALLQLYALLRQEQEDIEKVWAGFREEFGIALERDPGAPDVASDKIARVQAEARAHHQFVRRLYALMLAVPALIAVVLLPKPGSQPRAAIAIAVVALIFAASSLVRRDRDRSLSLSTVFLLLSLLFMVWCAVALWRDWPAMRLLQAVLVPTALSALSIYSATRNLRRRMRVARRKMKELRTA